jgi:VIT1/CCC1 family predicted Fe2+/Mn2+ transporter
MTSSQLRDLAPQVIFGLSDGAMSILGVVFYASGHLSLVVPVALSGGLCAAVSMAAGQWLSESETGPAAAAAMGLATLTGSVLPALPYLFLHGIVAPVVAVCLLAVVAYVVGRLRPHRNHAVAETFAVLAVVLAVSVVCALLLPGGAG